MSNLGGVRDTTDDFVVDEKPAPRTGPAPRESDPHRVAQRQKQVDLGKNTLGYQRYRAAVSKDKRKRGHAQTPDVYQVCSKRSFDGQIRKWRRQLHEWDEDGPHGAAAGAAGEASNPEAPTSMALETEGSYELVSHEHAAEERRGRSGNGERRRRRVDENAGGGGGEPSPKNGRAPRQASAHRLPLKVDSVVRNNKRSMEQAAQGSIDAWSSRAPRPGSTAASPAKAARTAAAVPKRKPASAPPPSDPAQAGLPELDWGDGSDGEEEGGWQVVDRAAGAAPGGAAGGGFRGEGLPGEYTSIFNNWACGDDELPDVTL